jgi:hypothetical protein
MSVAVEFRQLLRPQVKVPEAIRANGTIVGRLRGAMGQGAAGGYAAAELLNREGLLRCHEHWRDVLLGRAAGGDLAMQVSTLIRSADQYVQAGSSTFAAYRTDLLRLLSSVGGCVENPANAR